MNRSLLIAAAALAFATAAAAEPAKSDTRDANGSESKPAQVALASADQAQSPVVSAPGQAQSQKPAKPVRHGRVTSCRCADQVNTNE